MLEKTYAKFHCWDHKTSPLGSFIKVKLWAKMELWTIIFRKSGCRILVAFHLNGDDIRNISACAVGDSNIHRYIPP